MFTEITNNYLHRRTNIKLNIVISDVFPRPSLAIQNHIRRFEISTKHTKSLYQVEVSSKFNIHIVIRKIWLYFINYLVWNWSHNDMNILLNCKLVYSGRFPSFVFRRVAWVCITSHQNNMNIKLMTQRQTF